MNISRARVVLFVLASLLVTACNTMQGLGKDVERTGDKIEGAAARNK